MSDDSSYEFLTSDDPRAEDAASDDEDQHNVEGSQPTESKIVFDLPDSLLHPSPQACEDQPPSEKDEKLHASCPSLSSSSSFVPVKALRKMNVDDTSTSSGTHDSKLGCFTKTFERNHQKASLKKDHDEESWSCVSRRAESLKSDSEASTYKNASEEWSVAASSIISAFDVISLSGTSKRRCKRCSFLNKDEDGICVGCEMALVANPCIDIDLQLALQMQAQEEQKELQNIVVKENKRKNFWSEPLFYQARAFADEVALYLGTSTSVKLDNSNDLSMVPSVSLSILASRFIECFDCTDHYKYSLKVGFHFTPKFQRPIPWIHQDGFGDGAKFCTDAYTALAAAGGPTRDALQKKHEEQTRLPTIAEDGPVAGLPVFRVAEPDITSYVGWIVAVISCADDDFETNRKEWTTIITVQKGSRMLPLASFDATLLDSNSIQRRLRGLTQVCDDILLRDPSWTTTHQGDESEASVPPASKKPKVLEAAPAPDDSHDDAKNETSKKSDDICNDPESDASSDSVKEDKASSVPTPVDNIVDACYKEGQGTPDGWETEDDLAYLFEASVDVKDWDHGEGVL